MWLQQRIKLNPKPRGFHLVTDEILSHLPQLNNFSTGLAHLFIQHTSASLTLNENADPTVRQDFESHFNHFVPEDAAYYRHTLEGSDDMPAHLKASVLGSSVTVPVADGRMLLGTWQGIYLGEHRNHAGSRAVIITINGE